MNAKACFCPRHCGNGLHGQQLVARKACSSRAGVRIHLHQNARQAEPRDSASEEPTTSSAPPVQPRRRQNQESPLSSVYLPETAPQRHKRADYAPGTRIGGNVQVLLAKQLRDLMKNPIAGVTVAPDEDNIKIWHVVLNGPECTPYAGGRFEVELKFTSDFPGKQPGIHFQTPIWHPNIGAWDGLTCVELGESDGQYYSYIGFSGHCKVRSAACVLIGLLMLLSTPNPDNCLNHDAGRDMKQDKVEFIRKAMEWTRMYASEKH